MQQKGLSGYKRGQWWGKSLILAWTLSAVPAWLWQMQQINPYLLPLGIKLNNASKCWPGKLAVIVTFVEKCSWETECAHCVMLSIPKIISIVYNIAGNLHMTAANWIRLIMQYVTSSTMSYFHMLHVVLTPWSLNCCESAYWPPLTPQIYWCWH